MPTFIFLKDGHKVDEVKGADAGALEAAIKKHGGSASSSSSNAFSGVGQTLSGQTIKPKAAPSNLPDLKVIFAVLIVMGLWVYYGNQIDGGMSAPAEPEGGFMM